MKHRIIISSLAALAMLSLQAGAAPAPFFEAHCYGSHDADEKKGGIVFGGSGANRTVTVTPAANQLGSSTITITVSDGTLTASDTFLLAVTGTAQETWRFANFGTTANTGNAADLADANSDGELNLLEYATVQNPNAASLRTLSHPHLQRRGDHLLPQQSRAHRRCDFRRGVERHPRHELMVRRRRHACDPYRQRHRAGRQGDQFPRRARFHRATCV